MAVSEKDFSSQVTTVEDVWTQGPITIHTFVVFNTTASTAYIQMFRAPAGRVSLGDTVADIIVPVPASSGAVIPVGDGWFIGGTGLSLGATTTRTGSTTAACDILIMFNPGALIKRAESMTTNQ